MNKLAHVYYSGTDISDVDASWWEGAGTRFCLTCHRLRHPFNPIDIELSTPAPKRADMFMADHALLPLVMSERIIEALAELRGHLHIGRVSLVRDGVKRPLPYFTCTSHSEPLALHGRNPSIIGGKPVPHGNRLSVCGGCGIASRRERSPWFLPMSLVPASGVFCTDLGLAIPCDAGEALRAMGLRQVRIEDIELVEL